MESKRYAKNVYGNGQYDHKVRRRIAAVLSRNTWWTYLWKVSKKIDLTNYLVLPGIFDLPGDAFERHLTPRPTASFPFSSCLSATGAVAASNGTTTAFMAPSWSWEGGYRSPDHAKSFLQSFADYSNEMCTDLRVQLRFETHTHDIKKIY